MLINHCLTQKPFKTLFIIRSTKQILYIKIKTYLRIKKKKKESYIIKKHIRYKKVEKKYNKRKIILKL